MKHQEEFYQNFSDTIVVFIHGIIESPNQFKNLNKIVREKGYSYFNMLLPGHGKNPKYFYENGYKEWTSYVNEKMDKFRKLFKKIIIVGHSMGCLLAINTYLYNDKNIEKLFFLAIPFNIYVNFNVAFESTFLFLRLDKFFDINYKGTNHEKISTQMPGLFEVILWIPRYLDLFYLSYKAKRNIKNVSVPILYVQSLKDGLVSIRSAKTILKNYNSDSEIVILKNSTHSKYSKKDREIIFDKFDKFIS